MAVVSLARSLVVASAALGGPRRGRRHYVTKPSRFEELLARNVSGCATRRPTR